MYDEFDSVHQANREKEDISISNTSNTTTNGNIGTQPKLADPKDCTNTSITPIVACTMHTRQKHKSNVHNKQNVSQNKLETHIIASIASSDKSFYLYILKIILKMTDRRL